jgi:two-component system sensor histidine kinase KdpD
LLQLDRTTVCLFAAEPVRGMRYRCWSRKGSATYSKHTVATFLSHCAAVAQLRERGDPIICDDATTLTVTPALLAQRLGIRAMLLVPLATARGVMGFIGALREDAHHWQVDELRRACALAAQAATAIENALLFEALQKRNRHVEAINEIAGLMSRLPDPERRLDEILGAIVKIMGQDCGVLFVRPEGGDRVRPAAHYGAFDPDLLGAAREALRPDDARIARRGAPDEASLNVECQEVLVVALDDGPTSLGRLEIGNHSGSRLSVDDLNTLAAIGRHLCMALKNQRLLRSAGEFDALRQADALKSEFLATVSHDLRSPLTAIRASVDGLLDPRACRPVGEAEDLLLNISSEATRLGRLVDQLLDVSQIEAGRLSLDREWNELPGLLKDATRAMAALYTSHRIVYDIPAGAPVLYVDRDRFTQVVCNLLDNACKYAPPAKPIVVEARWTESEIRVSVIDGGPGVPSADREKIFARFYRGDRRKAGVRSIGLGLAISRGIVEAHGGRIWVDGDSGGSAFRFTMPLVDDRAGALAAGYDG